MLLLHNYSINYKKGKSRGIFPYLGRQISPNLEPDRVYNILRPEEELFSQETMDSFKLKPLVNDHCMLGEDFTTAEKHGIHGVLGERIRCKGDFLANMEIYSETLKNEIRNGKKELSLWGRIPFCYCFYKDTGERGNLFFSTDEQRHRKRRNGKIKKEKGFHTTFGVIPFECESL